MTVVILGCGYTGTRVAKRLLARGIDVIATTRHPETLAPLSAQGARIVSLDLDLNPHSGFIPPNSHILYSIPQASLPFLQEISGRPERIVHLSTTGVYGDIQDVDHRTIARPRQKREIERHGQEDLIESGSWSTLILRAAAIYGPGRGIQVSMARGDYRLAGDGTNFVSRIHVDDLASLAEAAIFSSVTGRYPVADQEPCRSVEIARFCSQLLGVPMPEMAPADTLHPSRQANRRVDGSQIRRLLSVPLQYPSYRHGIPASLPHSA